MRTRDYQEHHRRHALGAVGAAVVMVAAALPAADLPLRTLHEGTSSSNAHLRVLAGQPATEPIPADITGKFAEHLGANIYKGMDAQVLVNPTFAAYPLTADGTTPDGLVRFRVDNAAINQGLRGQARNLGWPEGEIDGMLSAHADALAALWTREGPAEAVTPSPDTGPSGGRAQRVEVKGAGQGIAQWTYLPLHRANRYEFEIRLRSPNIPRFALSLRQEGTDRPLATGRLEGVSTQWGTFTGRLELPESANTELPCKFSLAAEAPGQFVVQRILLWPADHVAGADPDIVRLLKDSHLPILRWPGGNFVSAYHWRDGVGPRDQRPTLPNYAWGNVEPNLFGTDEFIAFCRSVGCEPMICVNAGTGTPEETAQWIEYCNGPVDSPMGKLRAANGHPDPYRVRHWEVGNELWGHWQANWTTAAGYADRYPRFAEAMRAADPSIRLYACGAPALWDNGWNDVLLAQAAPQVASITDHPLIGGTVDTGTEPLDIYRDFMSVPEVLEAKWRARGGDMQKAGMPQPRLAITELQLFAHLGSHRGSGPVRLNAGNLVNQGSQTEALYDILVYHAAIRLSPLVELITHSAVVNHGGGLRKQHERVFANPCHYAQSAFAALAGAKPVPIDLECAQENPPRVLPDLRNIPPAPYGALDAMAAVSPDRLWLSIVHRGTSGPVDLSVEVTGFPCGATAQVRTLSAKAPWEANSLQDPERIKPVDSTVLVREGKLLLQVPPYSVIRVGLPRG